MAVVNDWKTVEAELCGDGSDLLVLGNGASIALDQRFQYASLLEQARDSERITESVEKLFSHLGTQDFELVLNLLWHTNTVNEVLGVEETSTTEAYESVRNALVLAVTENHADHGDVHGRLPRIGQFMSQFGTVATVNYDLIVYWAMMLFNQEKGSWFKDGFVHSEFVHEWHDFMTRPRGAVGVTMVFYPHGSLVLATDISGGEEKIARQGDFDNLLHRITDEWTVGERVPLFVSEGSSEQKMRAIRRSAYLSAVYEGVLPEARKTITFFGFGFGDQDGHLTSQMSKAKPDLVAASFLYRDEESDKKRSDQLEETLSQRFPGARLLLFDARSDGVWANPTVPGTG
jgi:Domain of unknown function (DUF4917)